MLLSQILVLFIRVLVKFNTVVSYQIWYNSVSIMAQTLRLSRNVCSNRLDKLIERQKTRYTRISFQEYKISQFHRIVLYFPSFVETIRRSICSCARLRHTWVSCPNIFRMIFKLRRSFVGFRLRSKVFQSPSQDSVLYYYQTDFCAPMCDLGTLASLVRFFSYWAATKCITIT